MPTPTRILRKICEELDRTMRDRTRREYAQFDRIMACAPTLLTNYHTDRISFSALATAMKMAPATLRRHFVDIPALLGYLIGQHLQEISAALRATPFTGPASFPHRRAAYLRATRKPLGAHTGIHLLMLNNLPNLPDDVRIPLLDQQAAIAATFAPPDQADFVLSMIENGFITPRRLEAILETPEYAWHESMDPPPAEEAQEAADPAPAPAEPPPAEAPNFSSPSSLPGIFGAPPQPARRLATHGPPARQAA